MYMKKIVLICGILGILFLGSISPVFLSSQNVVYGQANSNSDPKPGSTLNSNPTNTTTPNKSFNLSFTIDNPIKANNLQELIERLMRLVYLVGVPILVCFLLWAGFKFIEARGNDSKLKIAKQNLLNVVIGAVLFLGAYTIAKVVIATLKDIFN